MSNHSFFRLPLIFVLMYWLMILLSSVGSMVFISPDNISFEYIINLIFNLLFYGLPNLLLLMFVSSLALYRCYVKEVTFKNVLCLAIIALIIVIIMRLLYQFIGSAIFNYFFENFSHHQYVGFFTYQIIMSVIGYFVIGLIAYYGVLSLQSLFDRDLNTPILNQSNSTKIHLTLFILLWLFIYLLFLIPLLSYSDYSYPYEYRYLTTLFYLVFVMVITVIVYFIIKNCFSCTFAILQVSRIVKSSILAFVLSGIVNAIISAGMFFIVILIAFGSYYGNDSTIMLVVLTGIVLQLLLTCFMVRAICKRYFSVTFNESTL